MIDGNRTILLGLLAKYAYQWNAEAIFPLSAGGKSNEYLDCKKALSRPETMAALGPLVCSVLKPNVVAIGGLTMGADPIAMSTSQASAGTSQEVRWFSVRKEPKKHGLQKLIEGGVLSGENVVVVDDVVTTGNSTVQAIKACRDAGLNVIQVIVLVDREQANGLKTIEDIAGFPVDVICKKSEITVAWKSQNQPNGLRAAG